MMMWWVGIPRDEWQARVSQEFARMRADKQAKTTYINPHQFADPPRKTPKTYEGEAEREQQAVERERLL